MLCLVLLCQANSLWAKGQVVIDLGKDHVVVRTQVAEKIETIKLGGLGGPRRSTDDIPEKFVSINQYLRDKLAKFFACQGCSENNDRKKIEFQVTTGRLKIGHNSSYGEFGNYVVQAHENVYGFGLGFYRLGTPQCAFHALDVNVIDRGRHNAIRFDSNHPFDTVKTKYKERSSCTLKDLMKLHGIKWKKSFNKYKKEDQELLYRLVLDRIWDNLLEAMLLNGVVKYSDEFAFRSIAAQADDLLIIEKNDAGEYEVEGEVLKEDNLSKVMYQLAESKQKHKVLLGFQTKKSFTFKDLKVFKPHFKKRAIGLYRLGPHSEMIKVN